MHQKDAVLQTSDSDVVPRPVRADTSVVPGDVRSMRILVVDDSSFNIALILRVLRDWGFHQIETTTESALAEELVASWRPDLLMLDRHMPEPDGLEVLRRLQRQPGDGPPMPVLMLTADTTMETRRLALALGATDFLTKPFDTEEVCLRTVNLLRARRLDVHLTEHNARLERAVAARTADLERAHLEMLHRLARIGEYRDDDTHHHTERVGRTAALLGEQLGLDGGTCEALAEAAALHDIGKVAIPDDILLKPGRLTAEEFEVIKTHTVVGADILADVDSAPLAMAASIALNHHERWDGNGYPHGAAGRHIPVESRIVMVADVFDALTHTRPYKAAMPVSDALEQMRAQTGTFFDPWIVTAFERLPHDELI